MHFPSSHGFSSSLLPCSSLLLPEIISKINDFRKNEQLIVYLRSTYFKDKNTTKYYCWWSDPNWTISIVTTYRLTCYPIPNRSMKLGPFFLIVFAQSSHLHNKHVFVISYYWLAIHCPSKRSTVFHFGWDIIQMIAQLIYPEILFQCRIWSRSSTHYKLGNTK